LVLKNVFVHECKLNLKKLISWYATTNHLCEIILSVLQDE